VVVTLAVKPTASISRPQKTIDAQGRPQTLEVAGRHDPCLCPRIVPVAEAMAALCLADALLAQRALGREPPQEGTTWPVR
jgi:chorismate synthase